LQQRLIPVQFLLGLLLVGDVDTNGHELDDVAIVANEGCNEGVSPEQASVFGPVADLATPGQP